MMLNVFRSLPRRVGIAFSGGVDSVAMLHAAMQRQCEICLYTFDHKTSTSEQEVSFAEHIAREYDLDIKIGTGSSAVPKGDSAERWWSEQRNSWFNAQDDIICTGHHLDDAAEWYLMTAATGNGGFLLDYQNRNVIRPLITTRKDAVRRFVEGRFEFIEDPTNADINFNLRNRVRHIVLPTMLSINPGLLNTIKRRIIEKENKKSVLSTADSLYNETTV